MKELFKQLSLSGFLGHVEFDHLFKVIDKPLSALIDERMFLSQLGFFLSENDSMFVRFILVKISRQNSRKHFLTISGSECFREFHGIDGRHDLEAIQDDPSSLLHVHRDIGDWSSTLGTDLSFIHHPDHITTLTSIPLSKRQFIREIRSEEWRLETVFYLFGFVKGLC